MLTFLKRQGCVIGAVMLLSTCAVGAATVAEDNTTPYALNEALLEELVAARLEADGLRARLETLEFGRHGSGWTPDAGFGLLDAAVLEALRVADVNPELGMVILNAGRRAGLRPGMRFALMRGAQVTARVRLVDVRGNVGGAVIESKESLRKVAAGDRAVLMRDKP